MKTRPAAIAGFCFWLTGCQAQPPVSDHAYTNALAEETSPYLLQHAHNPVDWRPWGPEALAEAERTGKMLLISVGYAACHWCHVMERESFEDSTVAAVMNAHFVPVKVDREERPDVDDVYMTACHLTSGGSCGWPLNAFALPDGRPVYAGTYYPRTKWLEVLEYFAKLKEKEPDKLEAYATQIVQQLNVNSAPPLDTDQLDFDTAVTSNNANRLVMLSDPEYGGLGGAPKFPMPVAYEFLLHQAVTSGDTASLGTLNTALRAMARGGIYDQLGGGFSRYSTDGAWHAPHFEKMLYDNGQLVSLYAHAYQVTGDEEYAETVRHSLEFVARELTDASGGFYASLDADSEGEEGKFYVWNHAELESLLTPEELRLVAATYDVQPGGNWEEGKNILHRQGSFVELSQKLGVPEGQLRTVLAQAAKKLMAARSGRVRPGLDHKVLTSWNALMLKGYVDAYLALGEEEYLTVALGNANYLERTMARPDGSLWRTAAGERAHINAFLDDYAYLAEAYLALYQATFDPRWLGRAQGLIDYANEHFGNPNSALLYYTSKLDPALVARRVEDADNVTPSSNSVFAGALFTLGTILGEGRYVEQATSMLGAVQPSLTALQQPAYWSRWLELQLRIAYPSKEVAIVGPSAGARRRQLGRGYVPQAVFLGGTTEGDLELLAGKLREGKTLIYVCENRVCQLPVEAATEARALLSR